MPSAFARNSHASGEPPKGETSSVCPAVAGTLYVLTGPTASGKTEWALRWAEAFGAEIISCDSLLFYRGMDIGTAKPTREELARVRHHLIDICGVSEGINVVDYVRRATAAANEIAARKHRVLVAGGSGFYLGCFFGAVGDEIAVPPDLRSELESRLLKEGLPPLVAELERLNPTGLGALDTGNPRRVLRALERCRVSGLTLAELAAAFARIPGPFSGWNVRLARLDLPPESLNARIDARVNQMIARGLVEEVRTLRRQGLETNPSAARAIGYRETLEVLDGRLAAEKLAGQIAHNTRKLVKKQRTWFRTQLPDHPVFASSEVRLKDLFPEI